MERYLKNYDVVVEKLREVEEKDHIRNFQPLFLGKGRKVSSTLKAWWASKTPSKRPSWMEITETTWSKRRVMLELGAQMGLTPSLPTVLEGHRTVDRLALAVLRICREIPE